MLRAGILVFAILASSGCIGDAAPDAERAGGAASLAPALRELSDRVDLVAAEAQFAGIGQGLQSTGDSCIAIQAEKPSKILGGIANFSWAPVGPNSETLTVDVLSVDHVTGTVRAEGPSPLSLTIPAVDLGEANENIRIYVGAARGGGVVVEQHVTLEFHLTYEGELRVYGLGCTVAG